MVGLFHYSPHKQLQNLQDGHRSSVIVNLAKKTKKSLRIGKCGGPPAYTVVNDLGHCGLNKREQEALNLNFASLRAACLCFGGLKASAYILKIPVFAWLLHFSFSSKVKTGASNKRLCFAALWMSTFQLETRSQNQVLHNISNHFHCYSSDLT